MYMYIDFLKIKIIDVLKIHGEHEMYMKHGRNKRRKFGLDISSITLAFNNTKWLYNINQKKKIKMQTFLDIL